MIAAPSQTTTPNVVRDIVDDQEARELFIVGREMERPPYFIAGKGGDLRLAKALRVCSEHRVTPNSDGSFTVEGSEGRTYRVAESCSCPNSQKGKSKWCYHLIATCIYVEWQRRLRPVAPVELGTLRAGTLPMPPTTVDERLAQASPHLDAAVQAYLGTSPPAAPEADLPLIAPREEGPVYTTSAGTRYTMPEGEIMPDDDQYIPEPEDAPVATMERPTPEPPQVTAAVAAGQALLGALEPVKIPREFTVNIKGKTHVLYTGLVIAARANGLVTLSADWTYNDAELSLAHAVCTFADGRRYEESGDATPGNVTKGISLHFRRVALTRAKARCLRDALGISECSVEEMAEEHGKPPVPVMTPEPVKPNPLHPAAELRQRIWAKVKALRPEVTTREEVETFIKGRTGMDLHHDFYEAILARLEGRA